MTKIATNVLEEDKLINGGFLAVSLAIIISGLNASLVGWQLLPLILCSAAISPLAFNMFIIEYKKRYKVEIKHWSYTLLVVFGFSLTLFGLLIALFLKSPWAASAFFFGIVLMLIPTIYLNNLVEASKNA